MIRYDVYGSSIYPGQNGYQSADGPRVNERLEEERRTVKLFGVPTMRIKATEKGTDIQLDATERRALRKAASVLATLAKHADGEEEKKAAVFYEAMAAKWGKEPSDE